MNGKQQRLREAGAERSDLNRFDKAALLRSRSDMRHSTMLDVAYQTSISKNRHTSYGAKRVFLTAEARVLRDEVSTLLLGSGKWFSGKVWLDFYVEKPNGRVDAINVIDTLCDGIKVGIGVDDKWFSIGVLDWVVVKNNPRVYVVVSQEVSEHHKNCGFCGNDFPMASFFRDKRSSDGYAKTCERCSSEN